MPGHKNTFIKGMNQDMSKQKYPQDQYTLARNLRPITDKGLSTGAMENIQGNNLMYEFPVLGGFMEIRPTQLAYDEKGTTNTEDVKILLAPLPGNTLPPYFFNLVIDITITFSTPAEYLDQIQDALATFNGSIPANLQLPVFRSTTDDRIIIESPIHPIVQTIAVQYGEFVTVKRQQNFTIIGSTHMRDLTILFTVNEVDAPTEETDMGQIWAVAYDPANPVLSNDIKLLYYGKLEFSKEHPIEAHAFYENEEKQMVYWTDNNKPPRKLNIADPVGITLFPEELLLRTQAQLYPALATIEEQTNGALPTGIMYITYQLEKFGGAVTVPAPFSSPLPITSDEIFTGGVDTNYEFINYPLTTVGSNKSVQYTIPKIPKGYDKIYIYCVYEKDPDNYIAYRIEERLLSSTSSYEFTLSSLGDKQKIPLSDLFIYDVDFERVKTMAIKDNQLLFGNIKQAAFALDWDARAYRFKQGTDDTYVPGVDFNNTENWGVDPKRDVINPHNDDRTDDPFGPYKYKRNSGVLGGEGPNISYQFVPRNDLNLDQSSEADPSNKPFNIGSNAPTGTLNPERTPLINSPTSTTLETGIRHRIDDQALIDIGPGFKNFKNNRYETYFKGYMRDEVYRFGIVFYSLTGRPSEVKWIGDIRIPCDADLPPEFTAARYKGFPNGPALSGDVDLPRSANSSEKNATIGATIGIQFSVDVSAISDQISGFSIVRAPRREKDRTIVAQGALGEVRKLTLTGQNNRQVLYNHTAVEDTDFQNPQGTKIWNYGTFDSPDLKFISGARVNDYTDGKPDDESYYFKPVGGYSQISQTDQASLTIVPNLWGTAGNDLSRYSKSLVKCNTNTREERLRAVKDLGGLAGFNGYGKITDILKVGANVIDVEMQGEDFWNRGFISEGFNPNNGQGDREPVSPGTNTILFHSNFIDITKKLINYAFKSTGAGTDPYTLGYGNYGYGTTAVERKGQVAIVDLCRFLDEQYGGNTYEAIQNTEYISTGHYAAVNDDDSTVVGQVFGGDIFVASFPEKKLFSRAIRDAVTGNRVPNTFVSPVIGRIYPINSIINTDMRVGFHLNNYIQGLGGDIGLREEAPDDYLIPIMYHREKTLQKYLVEGAGTTLVGEYDTRIYISQPKTAGELSDSFSSVKPLNYKAVDGHYGPVNRLMVLNDTPLWWQDRGFGTLAVNPRAVVQSIDGAELEMGTGRNITDYVYMSNDIGSFHQWGVIKGRNAIYWFDAVHKKFCRFAGKGLEVLSDAKAMGSYFHNEILDSILNNDNPILFNGVTGTYDYKFNEVIMTFHTKLGPQEATIGLPSGNIEAVTPPGGGIQARIIPAPGADILQETIVYNEMIDQFSAFYDHYPRHYVNDGRRFFSQNPDEGYGVFVHDFGERTVFYDVYAPVKLHLVINPKGDHTKVFNNLEFFTEVEDANGDDVFDETFTKVRYYNEYQDTQENDLTSENLRRRMRTWRTAIPRDSNGSNSRIRNPYMQLELEYQRPTDDDKRLVIHDIITHYLDVPM
jgi:hypothetical protein